METIITIIIILAIYGGIAAYYNVALDNYDMSKVDTAKLTRDAHNGVSVAERRRRCVNGYYDKK